MRIKVLWLCNIILPDVMRELGDKSNNISGSWLSGMLDGILKHKEKVNLNICMPCSRIDQITAGETSRYNYYLYPLHKIDILLYNENITSLFKEVLRKVQPDIVHIWGTEFPSTLAMINACESLGILSKIVINIQGLVSIIAMHYYAALPFSIIYDFFTFRYVIYRDCIAKQRNIFKRRGTYEIEAIRKVKHVIGRTDWDKACVMQINPDVDYHFCNEILRKSFYNHKWELTQCERYSIFVSQATYPIKGLHFVLEAMPLILKQFPDTHLYIAGHDITCSSGGIKNKLKLTSYGKYIIKLIKKNNLRQYITFCGILNENQMCQRYLNSNVFVSSSVVENESNSLSEAKILGMPIVASYVGGVTSRISHGYDGLLYPYDAPYMLAYYIKRIFNDASYAIMLGHNAREQALKVNNMKENTAEMLVIYKDIMEG